MLPALRVRHLRRTQARAPNLGKRVQCVKGDGKVVRQNILKQTVLIQREEDGGVVEVTLEDLVASRPQ